MLYSEAVSNKLKNWLRLKINRPRAQHNKSSKAKRWAAKPKIGYKLKIDLQS